MEKTCTECRETKPLDCFGVLKSGRFGRNSRCKPCLAARQREWKRQHPDYIKRYFQDNKAAIYEYRKGRTDSATRAASARWKAANKSRVNQHKLTHRQVLRQQILRAYGGRCACCGESTPEFLSVDHIFNDGAQHRRTVASGSAFYGWLKKNGFPKDRFQLLCHNCNFAKGKYGECPHARALN